jgi:hypothetical protein
MPLYVDIMSDEDPQRSATRVAAYRGYLESIAEFLPEKTREFALSSWYYEDFHRCPHDAWLEKVEVFENSTGDRSQVRDIGVRVKLLSASHAGYIQFQYQKVWAYDLNKRKIEHKPGIAPQHGDWLADEITLTSNGQVLHEIRFSSGIVWRIECGSVGYEYLPIEGKSQETPQRTRRTKP